ncbi:MAG TPA: restriction endonuclease subunit S [Clostridiales bacterium]|nr:restriction endonuclease subunit S [Clostridiales bacterium]
MAERKAIRLGSVVRTNVSTYSEKEGWAFVNYLDTGNITQDTISEIQRINVGTDKLPSRARRKVQIGNIIYSTVRPNQLHYGFIKSQPDNFLVSTGFAVIDVNEKEAVPEYIYYFLTHRDVTERLQAIAEQSTSAYPSIKPSDIEDLTIDLPPIEEQRKIVGLLKMLDGKIKQNTEINNNLTEQARSIYQSWFIDYEPFGRTMPLDWIPSSLGGVATMKTDSWSPSKNPETIVEHYSIPAYDEKHYPVFEIASGIKSNKYILTPDSVMISKLNPDTKRIWRPMCLSAHPICSTEFIVYEAKKAAQKDFVYSILDSAPFLNFLCSHTTGSTNSRQRATPKATLDFPIMLPPDSIIEEFCQIVSPMYDLISKNIIENQSLAKARDIMLPKLMNGELDVSDL